ncbi:MAG: transcriptional regulator [Symbiobacteriaceae bacterium]|jgi:LCP family protein required for cell wall assembly|nr:transcriptional regulator [Symbiobacteriaceae bacterium]
MRQRRTQGIRRFWAGVLVGLLIPLTGLTIWWMQPNMIAQAAQPGGRPPANTNAKDPADRPTHVLVLGVDERKQVEGSRTDTMLLVQVAGDRVRVLSLPRDTLVNMEGHPTSKINSAYTYGGTDLAKKVAGSLIGIPVDYYAKVNLAGFRKLVDMMGGVSFNVPKAMYYVDPTDNTVIDLKPGLQVLDGEKAEQFVRYRYDEIGDDMGRIGRQQEFLKAAVSQALTAKNLLKLPGMLYTARGYVETDIPLAEQLGLAQGLFRAQNQGTVVLETLPGHGDYVDGISFFLVDEEELQRLAAAWHHTGQADGAVTN